MERYIKTTIMVAGMMCAVGVGASPSVRANELYDLGEYLAGDCTACHQLEGETAGIPPITGWDVDSFVMVMQAYKDGDREHPIMQTVARRFSGEDFRALAVFFSKQ